MTSAPSQRVTGFGSLAPRYPGQGLRHFVRLECGHRQWVETWEEAAGPPGHPPRWRRCLECWEET